MSEIKDSLNALKAMLAWGLKSQSAPRINAAIQLARSDPRVIVGQDVFDRDPFLLNVSNGTINLRTGALKPHDPADLITKLADIPYDPDAKCPTWERFLDRVMAGNQGIVDYLHRAVGYSLTGDIGEQCLFFLHGAGANGKSVFLSALQHVMGEYGGTVAPDLLMMRKSESHPTAIADLHGKRFMATIEVEEGRRLAESLVKQLTGGDPIKARRMNEDFWEFPPTWKIWFAANSKPIIRGQDYAIWRRFRLIPFAVTIPEGERDKDLPAKLKGEAAGILAWAVRGCLQWQSQGLVEPDEVKFATNEYRSEQDLVGRFVSEWCEFGQNHRIRAHDLYSAFKGWIEGQGERGGITQMKFGVELRRCTNIQTQRSNGIWLVGVKLRNEDVSSALKA